MRGRVLVERCADGIGLVDGVLLEQGLQVGVHLVLGAEERQHVALAYAQRVGRVVDAPHKLLLGQSRERLRSHAHALALDGHEIQVVRYAEQEVARPLGAQSAQRARRFDLHHVQALLHPPGAFLLVGFRQALGQDGLVEVADEARLQLEEPRMQRARAREQQRARRRQNEHPHRLARAGRMHDVGHHAAGRRAARQHQDGQRHMVSTALHPQHAELVLSSRVEQVRQEQSRHEDAHRGKQRVENGLRHETRQQRKGRVHEHLHRCDAGQHHEPQLERPAFEVVHP